MKAYGAPTRQQDHENKWGPRKTDCSDQCGCFPAPKHLCQRSPGERSREGVGGKHRAGHRDPGRLLHDLGLATVSSRFPEAFPISGSEGTHTHLWHSSQHTVLICQPPLLLKPVVLNQGELASKGHLAVPGDIFGVTVRRMLERSPVAQW